MRFIRKFCSGRNDAKYRVIAYVYGTPSTMNVSELTHANYAFGHIVNNKVFISNGDEVLRLVSFKAYNPDLKVIISIGGWGADGFSDVAYSVESREAFANSCLNILNIYGVDGIDIDWEYPVSGACGLIKCRPEDKYNFTFLLQSIRDKIGNNKILSVAAGADKFYINNVEINKIVDICNYINLMTYDFGQGTHNSNLYHTSSGYDPGISCDESVNMYLNAGVPANKINLGIPFFGYYNNHSLSYFTLVNEYINKNGWTRYWDDEAKASYLKNNSSFITYEDEESIKYKADYIKSKGLGGAMFWEYNQDYMDMLLNSLWTDLNKKN
ncbi:glycoside hydrolase family 18 protein [Clostridium saccharobutylicum]|uniref:chitinase n=1 Tax=Clostridium saccharobutylicum DSM 13864 TaxID=1345695 RepID=U5MYI0_CLOSA|nr:glycoside hydrolase family 18 protein [Clostridium saccharobutylicum]AGX44706.1 chitinase A1 [Clostridium saccharobutylicum DSM 13864]AQR91995.1 chitinase A1 precursor [Clostridium saccharobutylicum]AQS01897.1 chitinase A1 precursor [Clostridium saccharobutylicum]AQS11497.1 chitinase A1 precursor [Clostridium saccharobutylicum]AQS15880.1 chitinase A1 precursor [Clostridium saccharobutylicum]